MPEGTEWIVLEESPVRLRVSQEYVTLEDHWMPRALEISANGAVNGGADPETYARVEVNDNGVPRLTELSFRSTDPDSQGIRQADLRDVEVRAIVEDFVAGFTVRIDRGPGGVLPVTSLDERDFTDLLRFVGKRRAGRTSRDITPDLLERVAKVYRNNINGHPTKAVQHHFQVSQRMSAEYVSRARKRGLLPPTKRGKKQA